MEDINIPFEGQDLSNLTDEQRAKIEEYKKIHMRLRLLKMQMEDIKEETHELLETLNHMRVQDNKNNI
jgi:hypothetical protein